MKKFLLRGACFFLSLVLISTVLRLYFYLCTKAQFVDESSLNILVGLLHGVRFDISALLYINLIFFLTLCIPIIRRSKVTAVIFSALNSFYIGMLVADVDFYLSYGKKVDLNFFTAVEGTKAGTLFTMFGVYKHVLIVMGLSLFFFYTLYRFFWKNINTSFSAFKSAQYLLCVLILGFLGVRGGLQKRVLGAQHTMLYANGSSALAHLTSNTAHNLIRGKNKSVFPKAYKKGRFQENDLNRFDFQKLALRKRPKNVIFIFIESLSYYAVEKHGLFKKLESEFGDDAIFLQNFYANGRLSLDSITSSFFGVPSYFNLHIFNSKYVQNKWIGLSTVLKEEGMDSFFIHGATEGTQFFDVITQASGINDFYSVKDNYKVPKKMQAKWGVHDEFLYEKSKEIIKNYKSPFVGALFTTSSHTPFNGVPGNLKGTGEIEKDYFISLDYALSSLDKFFKNIEDESWFKDTLFIVTGDHSPPILTKWNMSVEYDSRIPLALYFPESGLGRVSHRKEGQHIDLPMTIFHMLGVKPDEWSPFGSSIFHENATTPVFYTGSGKKGLVRVMPGGERKASSVQAAKGNEGWLQVEESLENYIYRLEKDALYTK